MSVVVEQYNPQWPTHFEQIKSELETYLKDVTVKNIEHVGSTSVPGLAAKPIIDVDIIVSRENVRPVIDALVQNWQFTYLGELGIEDRHALRDPSQAPQRNIYVCVHGAFQTRNHLALRDTLRSNPALRDEYGRVKLDLAARGFNIVDYVQAKGDVIQKILKESGLLNEKELAAIDAANSNEERIRATKTERLVLREFVMGDVDAFYELESDPDVVRYQDFPPRTHEEARREVVTIIRNSASIPRKHFELAVTYENQVIGRVGAKLGPDPGHNQDNTSRPRHVDLWFSFMPKWQGRGFATEAVEKFIEVLGTKPLELDIECDPRNTGSVNMAKRLGFEKISFRERAYESKGEWVDSLVFRKVVNDCRDSQKVPAHLHTKRYVGLS